VIGELERMQTGDPAAELEGPQAAPAVEPGPIPTEAHLAAPAPEPLAPPPAPAPALPTPAPPELRIDADQRAILETVRSAVVAVNREGHPPQLTTAAILWDGETARFLTLGWARRTSMLRADPRIGLLVDAPDGVRFLSITGRARIEEGRNVRDAAMPVLLRDVNGDAAAAEAAWDALLTDDPDRAVILVEPDQVLSGRR
jgi:hypothetical protein